jgi:hypothetical protein
MAFDWTGFLEGRFAALLVAPDDYFWFFRECDEHGLLWENGEKANSWVPEEVGIVIRNTNAGLKCLKHTAYRGEEFTTKQYFPPHQRGDIINLLNERITEGSWRKDATTLDYCLNMMGMDDEQQVRKTQARLMDLILALSDRRYLYNQGER